MCMFGSAAGSHTICPRDSVIDQRVIIREKLLVYLVSMGTACLMATLTLWNGNPLHKASLTPQCDVLPGRGDQRGCSGRVMGRGYKDAGVGCLLSQLEAKGAGRGSWGLWALPHVPPAGASVSWDKRKPTEVPSLECTVSNSPFVTESTAPMGTSSD